MSTQHEAAKPTVTARLGYRNGFLCVVAERPSPDGSQPKTLKLWYPVREAEEAEALTLAGRPVSETDSREGIYIDEEGEVFQLAGKDATKPIVAEEVTDQSGAVQPAATRPALENGQSAEKPGFHASRRTRRARAGAALKARREPQGPASQDPAGPATSATRAESAERGRRSDRESLAASELNLRQKLAEVRRRIGYIQKRGHNERFNYRYVTAADIAGAVGDLLSELGVVVIPSLESISYVPTRNPDGQIERVARVVMTYTFTDVDTEETVTVKVPGEGLDVGDKATYKAMTGALKYALLQSFLLASGDDPEDDRHEAKSRGAASHDIRPERRLNANEIAQLKELIDETGTEVERVLAYYKLASLEEMTVPVYGRALDLLMRKRAAQAKQEASHAQG